MCELLKIHFIFFTFTFALTSCSFSFDECIEDGDCPTGQRCDTFLFGNCETPCFSHEDCEADKFCGGGIFSSFDTCQTGCRSHEQCPSNQRCDYGECSVGCRSNEDCMPQYVCHSDLFSTSYSCVRLPDPKPCGTNICSNASIWDPAPCCISEETGQCGGILESFISSTHLDYFALDPKTCVPIYPGEQDEECNTDPELDLTSCRTENGECGWTHLFLKDNCFVIHQSN